MLCAGNKCPCLLIYWRNKLYASEPGPLLPAAFLAASLFFQSIFKTVKHPAR